MHSAQLEARIATLERNLRNARRAAGGLLLAIAGVLVVGLTPEEKRPQELVVSKLTVVDDVGIPRVVIGQDPKETQRRSRSAGFTIHDKTGVERGGMGTFDDGSVVMALDAPEGVGHPMRDRIGMMVTAAGDAQLLVLDNKTRAVAKLVAQENGPSGVQVFKWDEAAKKIHIKTMGVERDEVAVQPMGDPK